jgi:hypothetical protein
MSLYDKVLAALETRLDASIATNLSKATVVSEVLEKKTYDVNGEKLQGRRGLLFDPWHQQDQFSGTYRSKSGNLSNQLLKLAARRDPIVGIIVHTIASQAAACGKKQENQYDLGFKFSPASKDIEQDPAEIKACEDFVANCGIKESRREEDKLTFDQWCYMVTADFLRYGHAPIERDYLENGQLYSFLPLAGESVYYSTGSISDASYRAEEASWVKALKVSNPKLEETSDADRDTESPITYVQVMNGRPATSFTSNELIFARINIETDLDLNGYAMSPLERAIGMVMNHMKIENHQSAFFTHGFASKGLLCIQGDASPNMLRSLQSQWSQQVAGSSSAWRTPILAGVKGVQWVPLTSTSRDMEYANYQDHVLRVIHGAFSIDPEQTGFGYLSKGTEQRSMGQSSNEWKVAASRERCLRPILTRIEYIINEEVMPRWNPDFAEKYKFSFAGLDAETREEQAARLAQETSLHKSIGAALKEAGMDPLPLGNQLVLNPLLLATLQSNMSKGQFMEMFMGIEGASERADLQYVSDPYWMQWLQFQMQTMQQAASAQQQSDEDGGDDKPKKKKSNSEDSEDGEKSGDESDQARAQQEEAEKQQKAMGAAAQAFVQANPSLFKSAQADLSKAEVKQHKISPLATHAMKQYQQAAARMVKEVLEAVKEDAASEKDRKKPE